MSVLTRICILICLLIGWQATATAQQRSLLWKVSGKGLQQPSYLYGTIHIICKEDLTFAPAVGKAMESVNSLFLEINMADPDLPKKMMPLLMMPEGYSFKNLFDSTDYQELNTYFKNQVGFGLETLDKAKPMLLLSLLMNKSVPCKESVSCEDALIKQAQQQHKTIGALESVEMQIGLFDSIPDKEEAAMIMKALHELKGSNREFKEMIAAYKAQDLDKLYQQIMNSPDIKDYKDLLLFKRNATWIPEIISAITKGPVFFAVGAGHLGGNKGIISLLQQQGYKVEAVN